MRRVLVFAGLVSVGLFLCLNSQADQGEKKAPDTPADLSQGEPKLVTVTYSVADLVVPIAYNLDAPKAQDEGRNNAANDPNGAQPPKFLDVKTPYVTQENALIRLICSVVAPESWRKNGNRATIEYFPLGMGLVVRQTKEAHEEIAALLAGLRRLQDVQVAMEVRMVSVPEAVGEKILGAMNATSKDKVTYLDDSQTHALLEALQNDKRTEVLQTPKVTVFNGQRGSIAIIDYRFFLTGVTIHSANGQTFVTPNNAPHEIGFRSTVCPTVSADRQTVLVDLQVKRTTVREPVPLIPVQIPNPQRTEDGKIVKNGEAAIFQMFFQQPQFATQVVDQKFGIPAGKTALIVAGKEQRQTRIDADPGIAAQILVWAGILDDITYSREACTNILLVTPRIIVNDEHKEIYSNDKARSTLRPVGN